MQTAKALVRLCGCAGSPEPSLVAYVISKYDNLMSWLICFFFKVREMSGEFCKLVMEISDTKSVSEFWEFQNFGPRYWGHSRYFVRFQCLKTLNYFSLTHYYMY